MINFVSDISVEGMLYGYTVRSPVSRGRISSIKIPKLPEGFGTVTPEDIPGSRFISMSRSTVYNGDFHADNVYTGKEGSERQRNYCLKRPWLADEYVNYTGEPVLLIAGPEKDTLLSFVSGIIIDYKEETSVIRTAEAETEAEYICVTLSRRRGNVDEAFKRAYQVVEEEYSTGAQRHFYEEVQGAFSFWNGKSLLIYSNTQDPFGVRRALAFLLKIPERRIRVVVPPVDSAGFAEIMGSAFKNTDNSTKTSGHTIVPAACYGERIDKSTLYLNPGFNGRLEDSIVIAGHAALLSFKTGKPVKMVYDSDEDFKYTAKRYPVISRYKTALDQAGDPIGIKVEIVMDAGAYAHGAVDVLKRAVIMAAGSYRFPNLEITGKLVRTNRVPFGPSIGMGAPQAFLGIELHTARLSEIAQMDPYIWKKKYIIKKDGMLSSGFRLPDYRGAAKVLDSVVRCSDFQRKYAAYETSKKRRTSLSGLIAPLRGIGLSLCFQGIGPVRDSVKNTGNQSSTHGSRDGIISDDKFRRYSLKFSLGRDENVKVFSTLQDYEFVQSSVLSIVKEELGLKQAKVSISPVDTEKVPDTGPAMPLLESAVSGKLLNDCISAIRKKRFNSSLPVEVKKFYSPEAAVKKLIANRAVVPFTSVSWAAVVTEIELDPLTFEVYYRGIWVSIDGGKITAEEVEKERVKQDILIGLNLASDYRIYSIGALPEINVVFVPVEESRNFIFKGVHELAVSSAAPSYIAAVTQASGFYPNNLPVTPVTIEKYLENIE
ncbi:MAG: xanthine dehydrogenase family protein [Spirochaetes bacterium]|nr:xanthine dehydrogenase family protein [Spirochaetota bacterium]